MFRISKDVKSAILDIIAVYILGLLAIPVFSCSTIQPDTLNDEYIADSSQIFSTQLSSDMQLTLPQIFKAIAPSTVAIYTYDSNRQSIGQGSGFFINGNNSIITNYHVMEDAFFRR